MNLPSDVTSSKVDHRCCQQFGYINTFCHYDSCKAGLSTFVIDIEKISKNDVVKHVFL